MQWYRINLGYEDTVQGHADDLLVSLIKAHHALSVSLDSLTVYRNVLSGQGITYYLCCSDHRLLDKLGKLFAIEKTDQPQLEKLDPVYGYFLGEDVTKILGIELKGERAPASAPPFAEPYRGGDAGYAATGVRSGNSSPEQQSSEGEVGKALGASD